MSRLQRQVLLKVLVVGTVIGSVFVSSQALLHGNIGGYKAIQCVIGGLALLLGLAGMLLSFARNQGLAPKALQLSSTIDPKRQQEMNTRLLLMGGLLVVVSLLFFFPVFMTRY
jgi:hypothetical protein